MVQMEITSLAKNSLKIKGKQTSVVVNPLDKSVTFEAAVVFDSPKSLLKLKSDILTIDGPGEYEIGGLKITGVRYEDSVSYTFIVDDVRIVLVDNKTLAKFHSKLPDVNLVIVMVSSEDDLSSATNVAGSAVLYMGDKSDEVVNKSIKEGVTKTSKYTVTKDKLPTEVQQLLLV